MRRVLWGLFGLLALVLAVPGVVLLVSAATLYGRLLGLAVLCVPLPAHVMLLAPRGKRKRLLLVVASPILLAAIVMPLHAPPQQPPGSPCVGSRFPGESGFRRWSLFNLVPEADQMGLGLFLAPLLDSRMTRERMAHYRPPVMQLYDEMERDPDFRLLGSVRDRAFADPLGEPFDVGHYYWYAPPHPAGSELPAIVFLHGWVGNFKLYLWAWKRFADQHGFAIVCPSFGFGHWQRAGGAEAVERARQIAVQELHLAPDRVWLAGLSNGGLGVSRAALTFPSAWRGLIYISAVAEEGILSSPEFVSAWKGRPVIFLHGSEDERISWDLSTRPAAEGLVRQGVVATCRVYPGEDHSLFVTRLDSLLEDMAAWVR